MVSGTPYFLVTPITFHGRAPLAMASVLVSAYGELEAQRSHSAFTSRACDRQRIPIVYRITTSTASPVPLHIF